MEELLRSCMLCPFECKVNRIEGQVGKCRAGLNVKVALASVHNYEEPCISGKNGSGTVFFSNCNLNCVYCQNYKISSEGYGKEINIKQLADIFCKQQEKKVHNINLVTPTIYMPQIVEAIKIARKSGFNLPIVYNSSGYEKKETIKLLNGFIDIYLPDFKYMDDNLAEKYSHVKNYSKYAKESILEMISQVGEPVFEGDILKKGVIIRHLVLPNHIENSRAVLKWIKDNLEGRCQVSVMAQYFPTEKSKQISDLNRKLTKREYEKISDFLYSLGLENGYIQELGEHEEEYVPDFNGNIF